jgi:hypothetical protein
MIYIQLIETLPKYFHKAAPNVPVEGRAKMLNGYVFRILETRLIASMGDIELFLQYPDSPDNGSNNLDNIDSEGFIDGFLTQQGLLDHQEDVAFAADAKTEIARFGGVFLAPSVALLCATRRQSGSVSPVPHMSHLAAP